ncbi:MAG: cobalt ECF transporter T component CbiQ [Chloroflexi bacterium]|jgi:cobalt/nickel transport system permease protein|nr:cobalt ECF transporter T component CbiQ [Chloroflexota bacterium]MBT4004294.1 cobalt ECF transporter T component CbiQ [Chloroflexota bacterium]MBT4305709.1 cobalt ECF transporter T component CbiQ [Chloroflexota bacterium]MBT4533533.1 cobalt ECF transporter T component CbiQ [Chloroflexota bacterium]MBT4681824.1 cobalt ECF transporter T component CbiQ [Chloroflexota bacterium]
MNASSLDRYQRAESLIHQLDPRIKILLSMLFILSNVLLPDGAAIGFFLSWMLILLINIISKLQLSFILKRSFIALPFTLAAITVIFTLPGETIAEWEIGSWVLTATDSGLLRFLSILVRSWLSVQVAILLTATTTFPDIAHSLRHLHFPKILISILSFMYRYLFVLSEEAQRLLKARAARAARIPKEKARSFLWQAKVAGNMVGQLFVRSLERSERVYSAMQARGFRGQFLTLSPHHLRNKDYLIGVIGFTLLMSIQFIQFNI